MLSWKWHSFSSRFLSRPDSFINTGRHWGIVFWPQICLSLIIYSADLISPSVQMQMWSDRKESGSLWLDWCDFTIRKLERLYLTWPGLASSQIDASYGVASSGGLSLTSSIRMLTAVWEAMDVLSVRRRGDIKHTESFIQDFNMYILLCDYLWRRVAQSTGCYSSVAILKLQNTHNGIFNACIKVPYVMLRLYINVHLKTYIWLFLVFPS